MGNDVAEELRQAILEVEQAGDAERLLELALRQDAPVRLPHGFLDRRAGSGTRLVDAREVLPGLDRDGRALGAGPICGNAHEALAWLREVVGGHAVALVRSAALEDAADTNGHLYPDERRALLAIESLVHSGLVDERRFGDGARCAIPGLIDLLALRRVVGHLIHEERWVREGRGRYWTALGAMRGSDVTLRRGAYAVTLVWA